MSFTDPLDPTLNDEGYSALPAQTQPPDPADALTLEEQLADPTSLVVSAAPPAPLGRAPAIDFALREFVPSAAGGPLMIYGTQTLSQWIHKCILTRRGDNAACHPDFGLDRIWEDLLSDGLSYEEGTVQQFEAIIRRGLTFHPRIADIEDFTIEYGTPDDDLAIVSFTVIEVGDDLQTSDFLFQLPIGVTGG